MAEIRVLAEGLMESQYWAQQGVGNVSQLAVAIIAGREIGIGPVEALRSFHFTQGGVTPSASLLARLIRRHPRYEYVVRRLDDDGCELVFIDHGIDPPLKFDSVFTMDDARRAQLVKQGGAWQKTPRNMLFARAMTNGVSWYAPDVIDALSDATSAAMLPASEMPTDSQTVGGEPEELTTLAHDADSSTGSAIPTLGSETVSYGEGESLQRGESEGESPAAVEGTAGDSPQPSVAETPGADPPPAASGQGEGEPASGEPSPEPYDGVDLTEYRAALLEELKSECDRRAVGWVTTLNRVDKTGYNSRTAAEKATIEQLEAALDRVREPV